MICKNCGSPLSTVDYNCPKCDVITGVEARGTFRWSIGCSSIGCGVALITLVSIVGSIYFNPPSPGSIPQSFVFIPFIFLGLFSALCGVILALVGLAEKNYKLVRKTK